MKVEDIDLRISCIRASDNPLSADVIVVKGDKYTWLFDVGASDESAKFINSIEGPKAVVISHFHQDHMANLSRVNFDNLYVGNFTFTKINSGNVVDREFFFDDGMKIVLRPVASSHSKGSVVMEVDEKFLFLGDSIYCRMMNGKCVYDAGLLLEQIRFLKQVKASNCLVSHADVIVRKTSSVIMELENIYSRRQGNEPYIEVR